jgi:hypothetical protein
LRKSGRKDNCRKACRLPRVAKFRRELPHLFRTCRPTCPGS